MPTRLSLMGVRIPERLIERKRVLPVALLILAALTALEWYHQLDYSLGILYAIPVLLAATALNRWQICLFGILCACARSPFTPSTSKIEFVLKFLMAAIAYCGSGLLIVEMSNNRRRVIKDYARLKLEQGLRRRAEEQLKALAEGSPAAVLTLDSGAAVQAANRAAHEMLGYPLDSLVGEKVDTYFPLLAGALKLARKDRAVRTSVAGWATRRDGQVFPIQAWISVYGHGEDRCLAGIVVDMSEEVRDRERENFQHVLDYNRLLAGAVSHEIRNLCSAISVVCSNLGARPEWRSNPDFDALTRLVEGLSRLASFELQRKSDLEQPRADLKSVLDQLRLVVETDWDDIGGSIEWRVPDGLPPVTADAHGLMQIFLNLCQNSLRAVETMPERRLIILVTPGERDLYVNFIDSGVGVGDERLLFRPFRADAHGSGLGLYISRELARSFGGDLMYVPGAAGAEFRVIIPVVYEERGA